LGFDSAGPADPSFDHIRRRLCRHDARQLEVSAGKYGGELIRLAFAAPGINNISMSISLPKSG
jgi:hypothetical protein